MTLNNSFALFGAIFALAIIPDASVFAVVARSIASGFTHGIIVTIDILIRDLVFIILTIFGLEAIAESMKGLFLFIKYLGGTYLIGLGIQLWRS